MRRLGVTTVLLVVACGMPAGRASSFARIDAMVAMSDGVALDTSLYIPETPVPMANGRIPLIVRQHGGGSNKDNAYDLGYGLDYVETGRFALLTYSHRGHGRSGGLFDFFGERTTRDFSEMLDWVERTVGVIVDTNTVGVSGYSQGGGESLLPAAADGRVKAAAVGNTFDSLNRALNPGDCFKLSWATGIFLAAYKSAAARTDDGTAIRWGAQLYTDTEDVGAGPVPSTTAELAAHSPLTYLQPTGPVYTQGLSIPVFWSNSWEDQLFPADHSFEILADLKQRGIPVHYWFASGGHEAGPNDPADEVAKEAAMLEWMDEFLRGANHGYASGAKPEVDYVRRISGTPRAAGTWTHHTAPAWPLATTDAALYLAPNGLLLDHPINPPDPALATITNDAASVNVANDAIVRGLAARVDPGLSDGLANVPESANPIDTARFATDPLSTELTVVGSPSVHVPVTTTATRVAQLSAKVWDVDASGAATLVWRGCRSFEGLESEVPPAFDVTLWPNAHTFAPGHRIALSLSAVDFPTFKPDTEPQQTTILAGARLDLPAL